jgi:hypothetical protein
VRQHGVAAAAEAEPGIEYQSVLAQLPHIEQQVAGRRAADDGSRRPATPREDAGSVDPRVHGTGELALHRPGDRGALPRPPGRSQLLQPADARQLVIVDEDQRVGVAHLGERPVARRGDAR